MYGAIADLASTDYPTNSVAGDGLPRWTSANRANADRQGVPLRRLGAYSSRAELLRTLVDSLPATDDAPVQ